MLNQNSSIFILLICLFFACSDATTSNEYADTTTSGEVNIVVDESFKNLFTTQIYTFESIYPLAKVNASYLPESEALLRLINDSCKVVVMCRDLTMKESKTFEQANLFPISTKIAEDAIALIVNPVNTDTALTVEEIKRMLLGIDTSWSQLNSASILGKINVVFDNTGSANARFMKDSLLQGKSFSQNVFAVRSNPEVIDYVSKNINSMGILSVNWISDLDDSVAQNFLKKVKIIALSKDVHSKKFKPYQAYIKTKEYPFTRNVYMINRQTRAGLGMGFVSFVAGDKGQLMVLKAGLIPAIAPVRLVQINN